MQSQDVLEYEIMLYQLILDKLNKLLPRAREPSAATRSITQSMTRQKRESSILRAGKYIWPSNHYIVKNNELKEELRKICKIPDISRWEQFNRPRIGLEQDQKDTRVFN